jgi:phosphatidylglycerophosphate synthase
MSNGETRRTILGNIPNFLTIVRIVLTLVIMYSIFDGGSFTTVVALFVVAAITDLLDGQLARRFHWESEFGRKADMIADRFLWVGTAFAFLTVLGWRHIMGSLVGIQLLLIMSREITSAPFALVAFFSGNHLPKVRYVGKATTVLQAFALPSLILSTVYPAFVYMSLPFSLATGVVGFISAMYYIRDVKRKGGKNERTRRRKNKNR